VCVFHSVTIVYAYMLVQLVHCLHEYQTGSHVKLAFKGHCYNALYDEFLEIIEETDKDNYHSLKLRKLLKSIGKEGRYVVFSFMLCY
jgi:hypothetical protein